MTPAIYIGANDTTEGDIPLHNNAGRAAPSSTILESAVLHPAGAEFRWPQFGAIHPVPEYQQGTMANADEPELLSLPSGGRNDQVTLNLGRALSSLLTVRTTMTNDTPGLDQTNSYSPITGSKWYKVSPTMKDSPTYRRPRLDLTTKPSTQHWLGQKSHLV